ncbi:protein phosphatase 1G (formerly 2C), magnesium-dependent, gamma isoform, isoform CRA_a [Mus musculus]|nr:protein phosphatase 1G (formerly 2C), magnesium-dependent, gamma isoform, isoform CRA_a [Mus musculus]
MGAYLSQPNTVKCSGDGVGAPRLPLPYGFSAMQGWRVSMEASTSPGPLETTSTRETKTCHPRNR